MKMKLRKQEGCFTMSNKPNEKFSELNRLIEELSKRDDNDQKFETGLLIANKIMDIFGSEDIPKIGDVFDRPIPSTDFKNQKMEGWFKEHGTIGGARIALKHINEPSLPYESKFYYLNESATKARIQATVMLSLNWEDGPLYNNVKYKTGIDFFLTRNNSVLVVISENSKLRLMELSERLTNTQSDILKNCINVFQTKSEDSTGDAADKTPQEIIHEKLWNYFNVESVNKNFYAGIVEQFRILVQHLKSKQSDIFYPEGAAENFTTRLLSRLLFCQFLRKKKFISEDAKYFEICDDYYNKKLKTLFFETLNQAASERNHNDKETPYLNGGLFQAQEQDDENFQIPDCWFSNLYELFNRFNFTTDESTPEYQQIAIDPEMLGRILENLLGEINPETQEKAKKANGVFYTPREIVDYMCKAVLKQYLLSQISGDRKTVEHGVHQLLNHTDADYLEKKSTGQYKPFGENSKKEYFSQVISALEQIKILDPACGSGAFPMGMLQLILRTYERCDAYYENNPTQAKYHILANSIYGVDIMPMATEISRLRAWLSLIVNIDDIGQVKPLPNLEFKFVCANSLVPLSQTNTLDFYETEGIETSMQKIREDIFSCDNAQKKDQLFLEYYQERDELIKRSGELANERNQQLQNYDPRQTNTACIFFDSHLMLGSKQFDIVIGNPPYVGEKGHKKGFDELKRGGKNHFAQQFYLGKMDLFYYFFHLGLNLLRINGTLSFITTNYYLTADGAFKLRKDFKERSKIIELINFNEHKIFASALGQHNLITLLQKIESNQIENNSRNIARTINVNSPSSDIANILKADDTSSTVQELPQSKLYYGEYNYIRTFFSEIDPILDKISHENKLKDFVSISQGMVTGADIFTDNHKKKYPNIDAQKGDPIFIFPKDELKDIFNLVDNLIKPWFKNSDIHQFYTEMQPDSELLFANLILEDHSQLDHAINWTNLHQARSKDKGKQFYIMDYLQIYNPFLKNRREFKNNRRNYWNIHRARAQEIFAGLKIVSPQRNKVNTFGYNEIPWFASADVYYYTSLRDDINLLLLTGILNSKLIYLWLYNRGKRKGEMLELYPTSTEQIPIPSLIIGAKLKVEQKQIIELVKEIIEIKQKDSKSDTRTKERQIDQLVYKLYDLTPEEIALIEKTGPAALKI
jgi:hypothetical protein